MSTTKQSKKKKLRLPFGIHNWHRHPMALPIALFLVLFFATLALFISSGGTTIGAADIKVVQLSIDGEKQIVPTRASTVGELLERMEIEVSDSDVIEPSLDVEIEHDFRINLYTSRVVLIVDGTEKTLIETPEPDPAAIVKAAEIEFYPEDIIKKDTSEPIDAIDVLQEGVISERIVIERSIPVLLSLFGVDYELRTHARTVEELLLEHDITLAEASVFPDPGTELTEEEAIFVTDPDKEIVMEEHEIPPEREVVDDFDMLFGTSEIREEGRPGRRVVVYEVDEAGNQTVLQEVVVRRPTVQVVAEGRRLAGISNPSENVRIGERMAAERGWTGEQWLCLYNLWQRESRWETTAGNPISGAYGIPQSLPGEKMAAAGRDWRTNPATQITWGMGYITGRYGTPCAAYNFFLSANWY